MNEQKIRSYMRHNISDFVDPITNEVNDTLMAEGAAIVLDLYINNEIPERVYEIAYEVCESDFNPYNR